jgi:hypothetical protein
VRVTLLPSCLLLRVPNLRTSDEIVVIDTYTACVNQYRAYRMTGEFQECPPGETFVLFEGSSELG